MYQVLSVPCIGDVSPLKFNAILSCSAGVFFFSGWWIMIALIAESLISFHEFLPGLFSTAGLLIINAIPVNLIQQPNLYSQNTCGSLMLRTCLLIGFMISFGSLIGVCYVLFNDYILNYEELNKWPGYAALLQNLFIFTAAVLLKCTRSHEDF